MIVELEVEVMKGGATCWGVILCSLNDTKPVKNISTVADNAKWTPIKKKVYSKIEKKTVDMTFHCLNFIYTYNFGLGSFGVADQLCIKYIPYHWMHNRKWWWYIFISGLGGATKMHTSHIRKEFFELRKTRCIRCQMR